MDDIERLERLSRLRESGALTDDEFQAQKARLLAGEPARTAVGPAGPRWLWPAIAASVLIAMIVALLLLTRNDDAAPASIEPRAEGQDIVTVANRVEGKAAATAAPKTSAPTSGYAFATSTEVIGMNPAYLESRLGPAREKSSSHMSFDIGGCQVFYVLVRSEIESFTAPVSEGCHPAPDGSPVTSSTTFGAILGAGGEHGRFRADCIYSCGNAADPTIELAFPGGRAQMYISVSYFSVTLKTGNDENPMQMWQLAIRQRHGLGEFDFSERFQCVENPPPAVAAVLRRVRVEGVRVGRNLFQGCST